MLEQTSRLLADLTDCTAMVVGPSHESAAVRSVQLVGLGPRLALLVVVLADGAVQKQTIELPEETDDALLGAAAQHLSVHVLGKSLAQIGIGPARDGRPADRRRRQGRSRRPALALRRQGQPTSSSSGARRGWPPPSTPSTRCGRCSTSSSSSWSWSPSCGTSSTPVCRSPSAPSTASSHWPRAPSWSCPSSVEGRRPAPSACSAPRG